MRRCRHVLGCVGQIDYIVRGLAALGAETFSAPRLQREAVTQKKEGHWKLIRPCEAWHLFCADCILPLMSPSRSGRA